MSTATVNSIAMADIATINGQTVPSGGASGYQPSTTGLLVWGYDGAPTEPLHSDLFPDSDTPSSYQVWAGSSYPVKKMDFSRYGAYILDTNGDLYTAAVGISYNYIGRNSSTGTSTSFQLARTGVDDMSATQQGCLTIESGSLYYTGSNMRYYLGTSINSFQTWTQFGTDTDWISITTCPNYPYGIAGVKGPTAATGKLYVSGYHNNGRLGNGLTSGTTQTPTLSKKDATTNFEEFISHVSFGQYNIGVVTQSGEFFTTGWGQYGNNGNGTTSNNLYMTQVGTDTNWESSHQGMLGGVAIKGGQLYGSSVSTTYLDIFNGMTANRTYQLADSDTDWEEIEAFRFQSSYDGDFKGCLFKKNGEWGVQGLNDGWNGTKANSATSGSFTSFKDAVNITDAVGAARTIDQVAVIYNQMTPSTQVVGILLYVR
jgi:hypothetical protein